MGSETARCPRCIAEYGVIGRPEYFGSDPQCAFASGVFNGENWNCATANALRDRAYESSVWSEDQHAAILPWDGSFIVLSWYKRRGRTEGIWLLHGYAISPLTLEQAESYLGAAPTTAEAREDG